MHKSTPLLPLLLLAPLTLSLPQAPLLQPIQPAALKGPTLPLLSLTEILPIDLTTTLGPLLTIDLALVLEAVLAGVGATLLDIPLIEALAEFLRGAGKTIVCAVEPGVCEELERWCYVASNLKGMGTSGGNGRGSQESAMGPGSFIAPPTRDSLMSVLGGGNSGTGIGTDPMSYLNQWIVQHHSSSPTSLGLSTRSQSSTSTNCHCTTIPPSHSQPLKSWIKTQSQSQSSQSQAIDPRILSALRLCALGGIAEALSQHAREMLMHWLEGECPLEEVLKRIVVGWLGVGKGVRGSVSSVSAAGESGRPRGSALGVVGGLLGGRE